MFANNLHRFGNIVLWQDFLLLYKKKQQPANPYVFLHKTKKEVHEKCFICSVGAALDSVHVLLPHQALKYKLIHKAIIADL